MRKPFHWTRNPAAMAACPNPPPILFLHGGKKRTGRTRKGYAASVSGTAANGCAVDGPREKTPRRVGPRRARTSGRRREKVGPSSFWIGLKCVILGESFGPGRARIPCPSPSACAGLVVAGDRADRDVRPYGKPSENPANRRHSAASAASLHRQDSGSGARRTVLPTTTPRSAPRRTRGGGAARTPRSGANRQKTGRKREHRFGRPPF